MLEDASRSPFNAARRSWLSIPDWERLFSDEQVERVRGFGNLHKGIYHGIDARHAFDFFARRYLASIGDFAEIGPGTVVADIGTGYGWLAMTFAMCTPARVVAVEPDARRLETARQIAAYLNVPDRIEWRVGALGGLPLEDREADISYCIEVLEHVRCAEGAVRDLVRITRDKLVVTTPNLFFPIIAHDTRLPFCHWLPVPARNAYARLFGREAMQEGNLFWSPIALDRALTGFRRVSRFLHHRSLRRYLESYPCHLPYGPGADRYVAGPGTGKRLYYGAVSCLGRRSCWLMPSLAGVFERVEP